MQTVFLFSNSLINYFCIILPMLIMLIMLINYYSNPRNFHKNWRKTWRFEILWLIAVFLLIKILTIRLQIPPLAPFLLTLLPFHCKYLPPFLLLQNVPKSQWRLVLKLTLGPILRLSVRSGNKMKDWIFRIPFPAHIRLKVDSKDYNQHFIKHGKENNSRLWIIFLNKNYKRSTFYI